MSEMLGNQFFLARNYAAAAEQLEDALQRDPSNKAMRKKIIICLNEIGEIRKAMTFFTSLIKEDADFVINTDPVADDCPCPELIYEAERFLYNNLESVDFTLRLGMLWLYCDVKEAYRCFQQAHDLAPNDGEIKSILTLLKTKQTVPN
jgi:tetratricopeptide (TPR) repeat protein